MPCQKRRNEATESGGIARVARESHWKVNVRYRTLLTGRMVIDAINAIEPAIANSQV